MSDFRPVAVVPTYNNVRTIRGVVEALRRMLPDVIVVDDGSDPATRDAVRALETDELARTIRRDTNGGKGAAVKTGLTVARELGFTHALQVDADGQHELTDVPAFLDAARRSPRALVLGQPVFEQSAPLSRRLGRQITVFWTHLETGGRQIADPMCGFRVYPLEAGGWQDCGSRMDFDIEVAVRMVWRGTPIINLPTRVKYLSTSEGGLSSFRMLEDNLRIAWLHTRLVFRALLRIPGALIPRLVR